MIEQRTEPVKHAVDVVAGAATISALMNWVPAATAVLSFFWVAIRIWETETVKRLTDRWPGA